MKKKILIATLILAPLILTACTNKTAQNIKKNNQQAQQTETDLDNFKGSLMDLLKLNRAIKCEYEVDEAGTTAKGTVYVSGEKSRSEMDVVADGQQMQNYAITDGTWMYTWSTMEPQGVKMRMDQFDEEVDFNNDQKADMESIQETSGIDEVFNYKCVPWIADNSKFVPPTDIEFIDLGEQLQKIQDAFKQAQEGDEAGGKETLCSICEMAGSEAEKASCRQDLGCD